MSTDRELLEWAAKAAGKQLIWGDFYHDVPLDAETTLRWNPLTDDGDALRLAVKLQLDLSLGLSGCQVCAEVPYVKNLTEINVIDPCAATRRAIVRAAAEIGKAKEDK